MSVRDLIDRRNSLVAREREMLGAVTKDGFTAEQRTNLDAIDKDLSEVQADLERALKAEGRSMNSPRNADIPRNDPETRGTDPKEHAKAVNKEVRDFILSEKADKFNFRGREFRANQADLDTAGGYLVPQEQWNAELIKATDDLVFMAGLARSFTLPNAASLGTPSRDSNATNATWGSELTVGASDTGLTYGKRELTPQPLSAYITISKKLLRAAGVSAEAEVRDRLAYALAIPKEIAFINGSGSNQPLGVFTVSSNGVSTARDFTSASSSAAIKDYNDLFDVQYNLKGGYWKNSSWLINRFHHKDIRKLVDANGSPVWMPAGFGTVLERQTFDTLLTRPVYMSEYAPVSTGYGSSSQTKSVTGSSGDITGRVAIFGDFSQYWTATALDLELTHLVELKALTNQDLFVARIETDGAPVLAEAFSVLRLKGY